MPDKPTGKALAVREDETAPTLLKQAQLRLQTAEEIAKLLTATIEKHKLYSEIEFHERKGSDKKTRRRHVRFEGWTTAGSLLEFIMGESVHPITVWTKPLPFPEGRGPSDYQGTYGYSARVEARTGDGRVLGGAETSVTRDESRWRNADDYALMSMAQTRAGSKALRGPLGWLVALAGFDQTPAEEMEGRAVNGAEPRPAPRSATKPPKDSGWWWACSNCGYGSTEWKKEQPGRKAIRGDVNNCPGCGHVRGAKPPAPPEGEAAVDVTPSLPDTAEPVEQPLPDVSTGTEEEPSETVGGHAPPGADPEPPQEGESPEEEAVDGAVESPYP